MGYKIENDCCGCATEAYPCMGSACPNRNVKVLVCDKCGDEVEKLYKLDGQELCYDCLFDELEVIEE